MRLAPLAILLGACGSKAPSENKAEPAPGSASAAAPPSKPGCTALDFAREAPVPEASGAAWLTIDGAPALVVVSDSGNKGAYVVLDPDKGTVRESGALPLGGPGDDLEGAAVRGGKLYAISSSGWIRVWERDGAGFKLVDGPYPIGSKADGEVCGQAKTNCGRNYEGLCLAPEAHVGDSPCIGFAAAKSEGRLYCLVERAGKLELDRSVARIEITKPDALADCAFSDDGTLFAGSNLLDLNSAYRIDGWRKPATAKVVDLGALGPGFAEVIAARGDVVYRMSDFGGSPSAMAKFHCTR